MKVLITGNMGYVGPRVVRHFRDAFQGVQLVGFDAGFFALAVTGADVLPECRVDVQYFGDVRWPAAELIDGVDTVVHLAAISNDPMGNRFEAVTHEINHRATVRLAEAAKRAGVRRFIFASSCSVYGEAGEGARTEEAPVNPLTAYARSKVAAEADLAPLADGSFVVTCLRFATACGMSERLRLDLVLNDFVAAAYTSRIIQILSDGTPWRPLIHVDDMARAMEWAVRREADDGGAFLSVNVGRDDWNFQVRDLAEAVRKVIPGVDVSIARDAAPDRRSYRVDFGCFARLAPAHQPRYDLHGAVTDLAEGLERMRFADADFRKSGLVRLNVLTALRAGGALTEDLRWADRLARA